MSGVLPIDIDVLNAEEEESTSEAAQTNNNIKMEIDASEAAEGEPLASEASEAAEEDECFEKPKAKPKAASKNYNELEFTSKGKPRKRKMTEKQLENLRKAQEKSVARRKELKAARDLEKAEKVAKKELEMEAKLERKMENDVKMKMKLKMEQEAKETARQAETWDEGRLEALMERTLDNYIKKKKALKPKPKEMIPPPQQPAPYQYQPPVRHPPSHYRNGYSHTQHSLDDPLSNVFGNYQ